jgi:cytochrome d ubiquinol oxidase subunit II
MSYVALQTLWFALIFVLFAGYAVLDGFDLGVGMWHLFSKDDRDRRLHLNAIGPVWDGNEVWLLTAGGALFAAFAPVYALFMSSLYLAIVLLTVALIFRAVALEFRSKVESPAWRTCFDWAFSLGSLLAALLLGVALGNVIRGLPIDASETYTGGFFNLLNPYALLTGIVGVVLLAMHGALFMACKTDGDLQERMRKRAVGCWVAFLVLFLVLLVYTVFDAPRIFRAAAVHPGLMALFAMLTLAGLSYVPVAARRGRDFAALLASSATIVGAFGIAAVGMFPTFIPTTIEGGVSLNAFDHSASQLTLTIMSVVAAVGIPLVVVYTVAVYWIFRGKVQLNEHHSY